MGIGTMEEFCKLRLEDNLGLKANYHTHTVRCKHAGGTEREYVEEAIKAGFKVLGFSDHTPITFFHERLSKIRMDMAEMPSYVDAVLRLKEEYKKDIKIYLGVETEYIPSAFAEYIEEMKKYPIDYMILSQHYFVNEDPIMHVGRPREDEESLKWYIDTIIEALNKFDFLYVGHPDLCNYQGDIATYDKHMMRLLNELKKKNLPVEVNLGGYREGDACCYPNFHFVQMAIDNGNHFIIGVDAHSPKEFDRETYDSCVARVKSMGGKIINL